MYDIMNIIIELIIFFLERLLEFFLQIFYLSIFEKKFLHILNNTLY